MEDTDFPTLRNMKFPSEWTRTKDRLPNLDGIYVCFMDSGHNEFGIFEGYFRIATFHKISDHGIFYSRTENITHDVLYWMLIPALPNERST